MFNRFESNKLATFLAHATLIGAVLLPLSTIGTWVFWDTIAPLAVGNLGHFYDVTQLGIGAKFLGACLFLAAALIQTYGLLGVRQTFLEAANGRALSAAAVAGFRRFAWVALIMVFVGVIQHTGVIALLSANDPSQPGAISIRLGMPELKAAFFALVLVFVAHVFTQAKQVKDENDAFL